MWKAGALIDANTIQYHKFRESYFPIYRSWFTDAELNKQLGPLDENWLDYILTDTTGDQFCFTHFDDLIAVAGIYFSTQDHPYNVVTDIAVRPDLRRRGLGCLILKLLPSMVREGGAQDWRANINPNNTAAIQLFEKSGWARKEQSKDQSKERKTPDDDMIIFEHPTKD